MKQLSQINYCSTVYYILINNTHYTIHSPTLLALYYREATVYTPFAATVLGLCAIAVMTVLDCWERMQAKKEAEIPPSTLHIQTGNTNWNNDTRMSIYLYCTLLCRQWWARRARGYVRMIKNLQLLKKVEDIFAIECNLEFSLSTQYIYPWLWRISRQTETHIQKLVKQQCHVSWVYMHVDISC